MTESTLLSRRSGTASSRSSRPTRSTGSRRARIHEESSARLYARRAGTSSADRPRRRRASTFSSSSCPSSTPFLSLHFSRPVHARRPQPRAALSLAHGRSGDDRRSRAARRGVARDLLARVDALVATSANLPGGADPTRWTRCRTSFGRAADAIVDGGQLPGPLDRDRRHRPRAARPPRGRRPGGRGAPGRRLRPLASSRRPG